MFEYFVILCMFEGIGVECEQVAGPFYEQTECIDKMLEQLVTQGSAACTVRYMEEIYNAPEERQQRRDSEREHQRAGPLRQATGPGGGDSDEPGREEEV